MKAVIALSLVLLLSIPSAGAQTANTPAKASQIETVPVEGIKTPLEKGIDEFVKASAQPSLFLGKLARWRTGICPQIQGFIEPVTASMTERLRETAASIGAPVDKDANCKANVLIYFTRTPQPLLDELAKRYEAKLGLSDISEKRTAMVLTHTIQAWYGIATRDADGRTYMNLPDDPDSEVCGREISGLPSAQQLFALKNCGFATEGGRGLHDGLRGEIARITIVADSSKLDSYDTDTLADYVTMLALSQATAFATCRDMPTITNLLVPGCDGSHKTAGLSEVDQSYLRALYNINPDLGPQLQQAAIVRQMADTLKSQGQ
jgi:hypothetical protein